MKNNFIKIIIIMLCSLAVFHTTYVYAAPNNQPGTMTPETDTGGQAEKDKNSANCVGYLGSTTNPNAPAYWIQLALNFMRYVAIIALIVLSSIDFIKAIVSQDNDSLKKALTTFGKRLVYCILIFFTPILVNFILKFLGAYSTCSVS